jgi:hypothetical protein
MALYKIGKSAILTLDDADDAARTCKLLYGPTLDAVLRSHKWRFAMTQAGPLAASATNPLWRYQFRYPFPNDPYCLRITRVNADEDGNTWEVQGRDILTDQVTPYVEYVARITDTAMYDSLFIQAFTEALAAEIAVPLTNTMSLQQLKQQAFGMKIQEARTADGMEGTPEEFSLNILNDVRNF